MGGKGTRPSVFNNKLLRTVGIFILLLLGVMLLWYGNANSTQAIQAMIADVYFEGEYRIDGGEWHTIVKGEHISSTKGDVTLRGRLKAMVNGELILESKIGVGTKAMIMIPKEVVE